ncbi:MAG: DUF11 domain-containing protein [Dehalococcoidia bacterium]|nr:DUF11 domain-containing protein [Dehalococcoidia bacterium]
MKRSLLLTLAAIAGTAILAVALVGFRISQGGLDYTAYAHIWDYDGDTLTDLHMEIDMDITNGNGPCDPVDWEASHGYNDNYGVAVCVYGLYIGFPIGTVAFDVLYDDTLNLAPEVADSGVGLDDNPDANAGATTFNGAGRDLGDGWDCSSGGLAFPMGDKNPATGPGNGRAFLSCSSLTGPFRLGDNEDWGTIAVINFQALGTAATDVMTLSWAVLGYTDASEMGTCNPSVLVPMPCEVGIDHKIPPPPTPTPPPATDLSVTLTDAPDPVVVGSDVVYTATVTNKGPNDVTAANLVVTLPPAKVYVSDDCGCEVAGGVVTCAIGALAVDEQKVCNITANATTIGTHTTTAVVSHELVESTPADNSDSEDTAEVSSGVRMEKDANVLVEGVQTAANLWIMKSGCVVPEEGKGCLLIEKWVFNAVDIDSPNDSDEDPEGVGAWEEQIKYPHKIVDVIASPDNAWLESGGRIANCTMTIMTENWILTGCVTKDDPAEPGMQLGPNGDGLIETILVVPDTNDLIYRDGFRPTKMNGVIADIIDENCEVTDTLAEEIPGTLPGGLTQTCGDAFITVRMLEGDLDLDCDVDVLDDQAIAFRYGSFFGLQLYDQWFDLEPKYTDFDIDIKDLQFVFGRNYSTCQAPIPDDQAKPVPPPQGLP